MVTYKINEMFYSLQGEGYWAGTACMFIRFAGCNLHCPWCDTQHEHVRFEATKEELLYRVAHHERVVLTGGEPTIIPQEDLQVLIDLLRSRGKYVAIETNGTNYIPDADWITLSPKEEAVYDKPLVANELKVVLTKTVDPERLLLPQNHFEHLFIMPLDGPDGPEYERAIRYVVETPKWRLTLQAHKILNLR